MIIYLCIFLTILSLSILNLATDKKKLLIPYTVISIILIFGVAFRENLGGSDYGVYTRFFENIPDLISYSEFNYFIRYEIGYEILNSLIKLFTENPLYLFAIVTILTLPFFLILNFKYVKYPFFTLLFFIYKSFFFTFFVTLRQSFALVIFMFAIKYIEEKKIWSYFLLIAIATLFHNTAIILFPLYFINKIDFRVVKKTKYLIAAVLISLFSGISLQLLATVFSSLGLNEISLSISEIQSGRGSGMLNVIEAIMLFVLFYNLKNVENKIINIAYNLFFVYMLMTISFSQYELVMRVGMYFFFPIMILLSKKIELIENKQFKILFLYTLSIVFLVGFIRFLLVFDNGHFLEYKNILN